MRSREVENVVAEGIAKGGLARRKKAFLATVYGQFWESGGLYVPDVADSCYCREFGLPSGSYSIQVVAALLDRIDPQAVPPCRVDEVTQELIQSGHFSEG